jgi:integration host factor subunit alpha
MVKISSFGSFQVRQKGERIGRNPKTGEEVPILPRRVLVFRASHVLKNRINEIQDAAEASRTRAAS